MSKTQPGQSRSEPQRIRRYWPGVVVRKPGEHSHCSVDDGAAPLFFDPRDSDTGLLLSSCSYAIASSAPFVRVPCHIAWAWHRARRCAGGDKRYSRLKCHLCWLMAQRRRDVDILNPLVFTHTCVSM